MGSMLALLGRDMAVDLGTANTLVYVRRRGIALNEPSVVALNTDTGKIVAVGVQAKRMIGRTPGNIVAVRPLKDGVIADFDVTERMLRYFIQKVHRRRHLARPRLVVAVPGGITGVEQSAVKEAGHQAGGRRVYIIEEPMAAAIGAGLPVHEPPATLVVDVGGGTTEVAVISLGGVVTSESIRVGGDEMDQAIIAFVKKEHSLMLGERTAEEIKMAIGSADSPNSDDGDVQYRAVADVHQGPADGAATVLEHLLCLLELWIAALIRLICSRVPPPKPSTMRRAFGRNLDGYAFLLPRCALSW